MTNADPLLFFTVIAIVVAALWMFCTGEKS
jgi:hypothetical protein